ncbi:molybdate ABC transporter substrate-binding protein [Thiospirochaeta perfilievii]|uniref:Molybdate ABC transporter substrate-binding protein n=1 Tax=Thiospirochaeta perfilievii TaxID=252967 RepID=A0A5C1QFP6_9SPIO|nr:molybdate ABC transporter substrate-binding protein [Thiospirochaeta perfilievii]QEN05960.1 molybdate ABC transporter substrate-binding protein [Thiospirochaeta perfilievii]
MKKILLFLCYLIIVVPAQFGDERKELTIYNAASTTDLIEELAETFKKSSGIKVNTNPGASGTLARQLNSGGVADVYISASSRWIEYVNNLKLLLDFKPFLSNRLVLIAPIDSEIRSFDMDKNSSLPSLFSGRLSLGDPTFVPAGAYGKAALEYFNWFKVLKDRIQPTLDVRGALSVIEFSEAELGIVYLSDAKKSNRVKIVSQFPVESHPSIEYYCGLTKFSSKEGKLFYDYLVNSNEAKEIFTKYGFIPKK